MKSFLHFCKDMEKKLGRELQTKEVDFLQWVFTRYLEEQRDGSVL